MFRALLVAVLGCLSFGAIAEAQPSVLSKQLHTAERCCHSPLISGSLLRGSKVSRDKPRQAACEQQVPRLLGPVVLTTPSSMV